jgi:transcriptional regulator with XRE-family HTH domain
VSSALGEFLRSRRALVDPAGAGLPVNGHRRVRGLRREEVAALSGMSADYYVRLEQGRERHPSGPVLDALAAVLHLDEDAREHLWRLAGHGPRRELGAEVVSPVLKTLMDGWRDTPAMVLGRAFDVLATNALAEALFCGFDYSRNLTEDTFLGPVARSLYVDWELVAATTVAGLRLAHGMTPHDPRVNEVVEGLLDTSPEFADMWQRNDVMGRRLEQKRFDHPVVGPLTLNIQAFDVRAAPGQELVVYTADPSGSSARALVRLRESL